MSACICKAMTDSMDTIREGSALLVYSVRLIYVNFV